MLAGGSLGRLEREAALAETDWRGVLVAARLAHADWPDRLADALG